MKKLLILPLVLLLGACSSNVQKMDKRLTDEAKIYSKSRAVYCGSYDVTTYYESKEFISVSCSDGSNKTIFLD